MPTSRGQHLIGKELGSCTLEKLLGYGGSSAVFLARQRATQLEVAVKVFLPRFNMSAQMQRAFYTRFLREAEAASQLDHPNILAINSYGEQDGLPYIVMPYMPGGTLSEYVAKHGALSLNDAQRYLAQIASALDYAHEQGCVHCDVKPANILLDDEGHAVLSDFGIAYLMQPEMASPHQVLKSPETLVGTPDYISPEQALGQELDGRSDVYSLGVTLYFLLTGSPPFKADTSIAMALLHVHEPPPVLGLERADVTPLIDRVLGKALSKWPEDRFQTAGEFSAAFTRAVALIGSAKHIRFKNKNAEKVPAATPSGAEAWNKTSLPSASVSVKPIPQRPFRPGRIVAAIILLLALIIGSVIAFTVRNASTNSHPHGHTILPTPTPTVMLNVNLLSLENGWPQSGTFSFKKDGQYHIQNNSNNDVAMALYGTTSFANFHLTVTMTEVHSNSGAVNYYGVVFRSTLDQSHYYLFDVASDGSQYNFYRYDGTGNWHYLANGIAPSFIPKLLQKNIITIEAKGNTFTFFINNQIVGKPVSDTLQPPLNSGETGLYVESKGSEVAFSNMQITQN